MKNKSKIIILFSIFYFLFSSQVSAARLNLVSSVSEIGIGQEFQVDLMLDAEKEDINAVEGNIIFQKNLLEIKEIYIGDSIVNFWIEQPRQKNGEIKFSGIIPGGFSGVLSPYYKGGRPGKVFSMIFAARKEGSSAVLIRGAKVLLNDGQGTPAELKIKNLELVVISADISGVSWVSQRDTEPPELFTPEIASDPDIFDGKWFLVFAAQDKMSGTGGYFVHETTRKKNITQIDAKEWITAESPYLLEDQKLKSYTYVKAIDKAGNARIVYLPPKIKWYQKSTVYIPVIITIFIGVIIIWKWLQRKYRNKEKE